MDGGDGHRARSDEASGGGQRELQVGEPAALAQPGSALASTETVVPSFLAPGLQEHDFSAQSLDHKLRTQYGVLAGPARFAIRPRRVSLPTPSTCRSSPANPC